MNTLSVLQQKRHQKKSRKPNEKQLYQNIQTESEEKNQLYNGRLSGNI